MTHPLFRKMAYAAAFICAALPGLCCGAATADGISPAAAEPYHIGVWYFTWWSSANDDPPARRALSFYGRMDPWAGVRDYVEGHGRLPIADASGRPVDFSARKPLLGFYDEMSQQTADREILMAASEGIEFFAFYWYLDPATGEELSISRPLTRFFGSRFRGKVKYVLAPIIDGPSRISLDVWTNKVVPKILAYAANDAYYRIDGRPVIIDFDNQFSPGPDRVKAYQELRRAVQDRLHVNPFIVTLESYKADHRAYLWIEQALKADAVTCFHNPPQAPDESYAGDMAAWVSAILRPLTSPDGTVDRSLDFFPCGSAGMDNRPWLVAEDAGALAMLPYHSGVSPEAFRTHLLSLKDLMDHSPDWTRRTALLYSWNEWGEGAEVIEPSQALGYRYADAVREVFGLVPRAPRPVPARQSAQ